MSDNDEDKKTPMRELEPFGPEDDDEVRSLLKKAERVLNYGSDYSHIRGQLEEMEKRKELAMLAPPEMLRYLCQAWAQLREMTVHLAEMAKGEHQLLKDLKRMESRHAETMEEFSEQFTARVLQCEREVRELRRWQERAREDFEIPDTWHP
jgi:hypothetical protein